MEFSTFSFHFFTNMKYSSPKAAVKLDTFSMLFRNWDFSEFVWYYTDNTRNAVYNNLHLNGHSSGFRGQNEMLESSSIAS